MTQIWKILLMQIRSTQKEFLNILKQKNLGEYHNLYIQSDTLLLPHEFENLQNMCHEIYKIDPARFLTAPGLAWQAALKKTKVKLDLLTDIDVINGRKRY